MTALASAAVASRRLLAVAAIRPRVPALLGSSRKCRSVHTRLPIRSYASIIEDIEPIIEAEEAVKDGAPLERSPWQRSIVDGPPKLPGDDDLDAWVDEEIARFVPMQPWPLNMSQVLEMIDPYRLAKYAHIEVPVRVAERIRWIENIPNWRDIKPLAEVYHWHRNTFREFRLVRRKSGLHAFTKVVQDAFKASEDMPHKLAFAMNLLHTERGDEYGNKFADSWLDNFLLNHIGTHFLMAQYLAAARAAQKGSPDGFAGLIDQRCNVAEICREVANVAAAICHEETKKRPIISVEAYSASGEDKGSPNFVFVPGYLKVILMEVLKNSCKATADRVGPRNPLNRMPIKIIVCADEHKVLIRINDRAGGIPFEVGERVWSYFYSTTKRKEGSKYGDDATELAGYGIGLPLSRLFAKYLGGSLQLVALPGYGTSVDIELARISHEQVEQVPDDDICLQQKKGPLDHLKI